VAYCSGAVFAIRREVYAELGGLDETFFCYAEESDLCWRARMRGLRCVYEPAALCYHIGSANFGARSPRKLHFQTRNRIRTCLQNYSLPNAMLFALYELVHGACVIAATLLLPDYRPLGIAYARAWVAAASSCGTILRTRAIRQRERTRSDREVLALHRRVGLRATFARYRRFAGANAPSLFNPAARLPE
jgi:GT2 family glycosyltransferase